MLVAVAGPFPEIVTWASGREAYSDLARYDVRNSELAMATWHKCIDCHYQNPSFCELDLSSPRMSSLLGWGVKDLYELVHLSWGAQKDPRYAKSMSCLG
jgi:hypothetical protein